MLHRDAYVYVLYSEVDRLLKNCDIHYKSIVMIYLFYQILGITVQYYFLVGQ